MDMNYEKHTIAEVGPDTITNLKWRRRLREMARYQLRSAGCTVFEFCKPEYVTEDTDENYRGDPVYRLVMLGR